MKKYKGLTLIELTAAIAIIGVLCLILTMAIRNECNKISQGTVVSKDYTPGRYTAESFTITIEGEKDGKVVEYTFAVPESEYTMYNIGDWYPKER